MSEVAAPALSTYQDEQTFAFQKYQQTAHLRPYLGLGWEEDLTERVRDYYSIDALLRLLGQNKEDGTRKYKKITLQFPDALVSDSAIVVQLLQEGLSKPVKAHHHHKQEEEEQQEINFTKEKKKKDDCTKSCANCKCSDPLETPQTQPDSQATPQQVWILADTAYSSCCIDEVAAEHVGGDIVIHFGDACLNAIQKLDAAYVFGKPALDIDQLVKKFVETYADVNEKVILMGDAPHTRYLYDIYTILRRDFGYSNVGFADIDLEKANSAQIIGSASCKEIPQGVRFGNRLIKGLSNDQLMDDDDDDNMELLDYKLFHITTPQPPHLLFLTTKFNSLTIYEPSNNSTTDGPFPSLMKRYRYMHMARTSGTVGILVNTLSLRNTTQLIRTVSSKIKEAGKKSYMFVVGKPNVAKLANFESIEVWCILGCGQGGIILDQSNEFYKPIITPYELEMALAPQVSWTGKWVTEFEKLLENDNGEDEDCEASLDDTKSSSLSEDEDDDDAPEFNPVTGKFVTTSRPLRTIQHLEIDSSAAHINEEGQLVKAFSNTVAIKNTVSTSAIHLQTRQWTGLGSDFAKDGEDGDVDQEGALVEEGRGGVARGYDFDVENINR